MYKTQEEWIARYVVPEYHENKEITGSYERNLAAKCTNGTFVGTLDTELNVKTWRGIPFAKIPARFERAVGPEKSDKIFEAYYFGKSCMQARDNNEKSSLYEQDDLDCLSLAITTGNDELKNKPVLVYIHGGGWVNGGAADPLYDGKLFAYYNPDIVLVNIQYRINFIGMINLGVKDEEGNYMLRDYTDIFKTATNNGMLDQVQALRWIKKNIEAFGGDPENITISGESAGCGSVYNLLTMHSDPDNHFLEKSERLFQKVIAMSGGFNQGISLKASEDLTRKFLADHPKITTIKEIQELPMEDLYNWRVENILYCNNYIIDGVVVSADMYKTFNENVDPEITILTGATTNEFAYYKDVLKPIIEAVPAYSFKNICKSIYELVSGKGEDVYDFEPSAEYVSACKDYFDALVAQGFTTFEDKIYEFANDFTLQGFNYYLGIKQFKRGAKVFSYTFDIPYDGAQSELRAAHAVDCFYTFGNFDGDFATGTNKQVEISIKWQKMLANFCRTGNPSISGLDWKEYSEDYTTAYIGSDMFDIQKRWCADRYEAFEKMVDNNEMMKYVTPWIPMFAHIDVMAARDPQ